MNIDQINPGRFGPEFTHISTCTTKNQNFFTTLAFGFLSQCSRLKSTTHFQNSYNQVAKVIYELTAMQGLEEIYKSSLTEFLTNLNYSNQYDSTQFIPWLAQMNLEGITTAMRLILYVVLKNSNHPESDSVVNTQIIPRDDKGILKLFANKLGLSIFYIVDGYQGEMIEEDLQLRPVILIGKYNDEYCLLVHKDYALQKFDSFPYVWVKVSAPPVNLPPVGPMPGSNQGPAGKISDTILTPLLKSLIKLFINRNWRFSQEEGQKIKEILKVLKKFEFYQNEVKVLKSLLEQSKCEHSFNSYYRFKCGKSHCFECLKEEVKLKKLLKYQIFCSCKALVPDREASYFFKDEIKVSYQFVSTIPINPEDTATLSARNYVNPAGSVFSQNNPINPGYGGDRRMPEQPPNFPPRMMENDRPPQLPPSGNTGGFPNPPPGVPGNPGPYGSGQNLQQGLPPNQTGAPLISSQAQPTGPPGFQSGSNGFPPQSTGMPPGPPQFSPPIVRVPSGPPPIAGQPTNAPNGPPPFTGQPTGAPTGHSGFPPGPSGFPPGPSGFPPAPLGFSNGPQGFPPGPPGLPSVPPGIINKPPGAPDGPMFNSGMNPPPSLGDSSMSLPKVSFCQKCNLPINPSDLVMSNGKPYHRNHV